MKTSVVLGLCYGDEGKGATTSFLSNRNDLVVRFNGGHQAGHSVCVNGHSHVFSNFGSGTLRGAHTYWSEYCTFYPKSFHNEREALTNMGVSPVHYIHPLAMITTPFDIWHNREQESSKKHGSVGVGFGATIARNQNTPHKLYAIDLTYEKVLVHKLRQIADFYKIENPSNDIDAFCSYVKRINLNICVLSEICENYNHIIFEGAQGIMLDMDFGYFPNVTRSNTTSKNAMQIIKDHNLPSPDIYYAIRSYLTRHGNGVMPNETNSLSFEDKTNVSHRYQGEFRQAYHSLEELKYALRCDNIFSGNAKTKNLSIICLDQTDDKILIDNEAIFVGDFLETINNPFDVILMKSSVSSGAFTKAFKTMPQTVK